MSQPDHQVVVIGGGFSGIGATILLEKAGFDDVLVLEMGEDIGGAWFHNTYPGVAVDTPSFGYSFSFEQNPSWSRVFAPGKELITPVGRPMKLSDGKTIAALMV